MAERYVEEIHRRWSLKLCQDLVLTRGERQEKLLTQREKICRGTKIQARLKQILAKKTDNFLRILHSITIVIIDIIVLIVT